ncbi:MAG: hypothetical protein E7260_01520 [Lachnospiraceae bacterium]|nr:hypothetical protein [Lachnospiraceae bacterium]
MSWCPKCKNEYRAGIEICPDCNEELVAELSEESDSKFVPLFQTSDSELADKVYNYLIHCKIDAKKLPLPNSSELVYALLVPESDAQEAARYTQTVLMYEAKEKEKEENGGEDIPTPKKGRIPVSNLHLSAKDRYQEYRSSGIMLLVFAALIIAFAFLNFFEIITIMASGPSLVVLGIAAVIFIYLGISSLKSTGKLLEEADEEEKTTSEILTFLKVNFPKEVLDQMQDDSMSDELLYFTQMNAMKEALLAQCPNTDENYIDAILEDYFNSLENQ